MSTTSNNGEVVAAALAATSDTLDHDTLELLVAADSEGVHAVSAADWELTAEAMERLTAAWSPHASAQLVSRYAERLGLAERYAEHDQPAVAAAALTLPTVGDEVRWRRILDRRSPPRLRWIAVKSLRDPTELYDRARRGDPPWLPDDPAVADMLERGGLGDVARAGKGEDDRHRIPDDAAQAALLLPQWVSDIVDADEDAAEVGDVAALADVAGASAARDAVLTLMGNRRPDALADLMASRVAARELARVAAGPLSDTEADATASALMEAPWDVVESELLAAARRDTTHPTVLHSALQRFDDRGTEALLSALDGEAQDAVAVAVWHMAPRESRVWRAAVRRLPRLILSLGTPGEVEQAADDIATLGVDEPELPQTALRVLAENGVYPSAPWATRLAEAVLRGLGGHGGADPEDRTLLRYALRSNASARVVADAAAGPAGDAVVAAFVETLRERAVDPSPTARFEALWRDAEPTARRHAGALAEALLEELSGRQIPEPHVWPRWQIDAVDVPQLREKLRWSSVSGVRVLGALLRRRVGADDAERLADMAAAAASWHGSLGDLVDTCAAANQSEAASAR